MRHVLVLSVLAAVACVGASPDTKLTPANFAQEVFQPGLPYIVKFYAPWCGHCRAMEKDYEAVAAKLKGLVGVGSVNCDDEASKPLCGQFGIKGFPTIKIFGAGVNKQGTKKPTDYQGARQTGAIASAGLAKLHAKRIEVATADTLESILSGKKVALLFSKKKTPSNLYKALSMQFGKRLNFALISEADGKDAAAKYGVTQYPALIVVDDGAAPAELYTGKLKIKEITQWLDKFAAPKPKRANGSSGGGGGSSGQEPPKSKPVEYDMKVEEISTPDRWETKCTAEAGFCGVAFFDPLEDEQRHAKFLSVLEELMPKVFKNARLMWVNAPEHYSFFESFRLGGGFPNFGLYQPKSKRVVPYRGSFTTEDILEWFQKKVLIGRPQSFAADKLEFK